MCTLCVKYILVVKILCVWYSGAVIQCHPEQIRVGVHKYLTECYFMRVHTFCLHAISLYGWSFNWQRMVRS